MIPHRLLLPARSVHLLLHLLATHTTSLKLSLRHKIKCIYLDFCQHGYHTRSLFFSRIQFFRLICKCVRIIVCGVGWEGGLAGLKRSKAIHLLIRCKTALLKKTKIRSNVRVSTAYSSARFRELRSFYSIILCFFVRTRSCWLLFLAIEFAFL